MIILNYQDRRPIYEQVVEKFQMLIIKGALKPDEQMPSVRKLAIELSLNPNTIQRAFSVLEVQGYIYAVKGRGNFVSGQENYIKDCRNEIYKQFEEAVIQALDAGIEKAVLVECVNSAAEKGVL